MKNREELIEELKHKSQSWHYCVGRDNHTEECVDWEKIADFIIDDRKRVVEPLVKLCQAIEETLTRTFN
jgi:hypothetical protein